MRRRIQRPNSKKFPKQNYLEHHHRATVTAQPRNLCLREHEFIRERVQETRQHNHYLQLVSPPGRA